MTAPVLSSPKVLARSENWDSCDIFTPEPDKFTREPALSLPVKLRGDTPVRPPRPPRPVAAEPGAAAVCAAVVVMGWPWMPEPCMAREMMLPMPGMPPGAE